MSDKQPSAWERMQEFQANQQLEETGVSAYLDTLPYSPDPFQEEALNYVALGETTLVCAPTGAGKTVVGEGAAFLAHMRGERAFYTTPIKALSNQKYLELVDKFGSENVGLLTGDTSINASASIVVMTTEVLRNMIYQGADLSSLGAVVLDEAHYLSDKFRGPVWEEVIIQLPPHVQIVALSATISNWKEFAAWIKSVRGSCRSVIDNKRPVPLYQQMVAGGNLYPLYAHPKKAAHSKNPASEPLNRALLEVYREMSSRPRYGRGRRGDWDQPRASRPRPYSRRATLALLEDRDLLPAIVFIFSRAGCDEAAAEAATYGLDLTNRDEKREIRAATDAALAEIPIADHGALGLARWAQTLEMGVAPHHAGLLPQQKETTELLFTRGLLKIIFATETLALGINMPARTVLLESLEKWDGSEHVRISPRDYTQLTGRAGRRGIDVEGHAVVPLRTDATPEEVAALSSGRKYPLDSAFHPNYNMAVNLLGRATVEQAHEVLESSFAQYQADASVVYLSRDLRKIDEETRETKAALECEYGDAAEYFELRDRSSRLQKRAAKLAREDRKQYSLDVLKGLQPGDVIDYRRGRRRRQAVVVQGPSGNFSDPLVKVVVDDGRLATVGPREAQNGLDLLGRISIEGRSGRRPKDRSSLADDVRELRARSARKKGYKRPGDETQRVLKESRLLEDQVRSHPVHACPERETHATLGHRYARLLRERNEVAAAINTRTDQIVGEFEQVCEVLRAMDFLDPNVVVEDGQVTDQVTARGERLRRIFGDRDLLIALALANRSWEDLGPEELAAIVSAVVFEPRGDDVEAGAPTSFPTLGLEQAWHELEALYTQIHREEEKVGRVITNEPSAVMMKTVYDWANGTSLVKIMERTDLSGGDFVRWVRQVVDMLDQIRRSSTDKEDPTVQAATKARSKLLHGVVAWTEFA